MVESVEAIFFAGWLPILRVLVVGTAGYVFLLLALRAGGPRTLAKTNIFDFVILVSLGSVYGRILTATDVALLEACIAYALVIGLHYGVSLLRVRDARLASLLDAEPVLLYFDGRYGERSLHRVRLNEHDVEAAVRKKGYASMREVSAVVLEADGDLSVIGRPGTEQPLVAKLAR